MLLLLQRDVDFALAYHHRRHHGDVYVGGGGQYVHAVNVSGVPLFYYVVVVLPLLGNKKYQDRINVYDNFV